MRIRRSVPISILFLLIAVHGPWHATLAGGGGGGQIGGTSPGVTGTQLTPGTFNRRSAARIVVNVTPGANPVSTGLQVTLNLSPLGGLPAAPLSDAGGGACDEVAGDRAFTACLLLFPTVPVGAVTLTGTVRDAEGRTAPVSVPVTVAADSDGDSDGLTDKCESTFGLNPSSAAGIDGSLGDPDGDGVTNAQECTSGTHPRGQFSRYLAEGVSNAFFKTRIALFNPSTTPVTALVRLQPEGAIERSFVVTVPALARRTVTPEDVLTVTGAPFATVVESDSELVVDRLVWWGEGGYGSHAETAVRAPSTTWYLAEGATGWRFSLFYLLQNPNPTDAQVQVTYLRGPTDPVLVRTYVVGGRQRRTIAVDEEQFPEGSGNTPLASTDVSASIVSLNNVPIVVERSMYMSPDGQPFGAGHAGAGLTSLSNKWFFAEGATGGFFDEFLLLANPGDETAVVHVNYMPEGGASFNRDYEVAPRSRRTIWVDQEPGLENTAVSASIAATRPIAAERAMWWPGSGDSWREAHVSAGATSSSARWGVADLEIGGPFAADSYVLISNGGTLTLYFDDGTAPVECATATGGRQTIHINECPGVAGKRFVSAIVNGTVGTVVERAVYYSSTSTFGAGGAALATQLPASDTVAFAMNAAGGGTATLPQIATVSFAPGSLPAGTQVVLSATDLPETDTDFNDSTVLFGPVGHLSYELRIVTNPPRPTRDTTVTMQIPAAFLSTLPANAEIKAFAQFFEDGGSETLDHFELLPSTLTGQTIKFVLPMEAFTGERRTDGRFEAIVVLAALPTKPTAVSLATVPDGYRIVAPSGLAAATGTCSGASLGAPLANVEVFSAYNGKNHHGTDLVAPDNTNVLSMADGVIEKYGFDEKALKKADPRSGKMVKGWGHYIVVLHTDGSRSLYAHLRPPPNPLPATPVAIKKGQKIGSSDNSGGSSGAHLHVEYAPNGKIYESAHKVDPAPCVGGNVNGSITVSDNGTAADDAFLVKINGLTVCQTAIGASNTCAVGALRAGNATLTITCTIAPDNLGTFAISLSNGLQFGIGGTYQSSILTQGGSATYGITIPTTMSGLP